MPISVIAEYAEYVLHHLVVNFLVAALLNRLEWEVICIGSPLNHLIFVLGSLANA